MKTFENNTLFVIPIGLTSFVAQKQADGTLKAITERAMEDEPVDEAFNRVRQRIQSEIDLVRGDIRHAEKARKMMNVTLEFGTEAEKTKIKQILEENPFEEYMEKAQKTVAMLETGMTDMLELMVDHNIVIRELDSDGKMGKAVDQISTGDVKNLLDGYKKKD